MPDSGSRVPRRASCARTEEMTKMGGSSDDANVRRRTGLNARQIFRKALMLLDRGAAERGEGALRMAVDAAEREGDRVALVQALVCLGDLLCDTSRYTAARPLLERALGAAGGDDGDDALACERDRAAHLLKRMPSVDFKNRTCTIDDFIALVRAKADRSEGYDPTCLYDVYGEDTDGDDFRVAQTIYVGDTVQVDGDDREIYPEPVSALGYVFLYSGEHFQDVVDLACRQKPDASIEDIVRCLNHFGRYDDFLDLDAGPSPE
ncbi:hypothetical protein [Burkholderia ubonensis]|nr:hypothetical protein [Burkholderia ubonensis]